MVYAWLGSDVNLNEFDRKTLRSKICHSLLPASGVAGTQDHKNAFGGELPRDFPPQPFIRTCNECNRFSHRNV
jgi:hypothetical protein